MANPTKPVVVNGAANFAQNGKLFTVTNSPNAIINWGSFSINAALIVATDRSLRGATILPAYDPQTLSENSEALENCRQVSGGLYDCVGVIVR